MGRVKLLGPLTAIIALTACETAEQRKPIVRPPAAAVAPEPLPLRPPSRALLSFNSFNRQAPDAIDVLIDRVEAIYIAALGDYRSGKMEKAKKEFDQALSLLLESKLDIEGDDRLSAEFNKLIENIHGVELAAIERGDGLSEHTYEPPPIESFAGLTFPVDPKVKQQVQQEIQSVRSDLPLVSNDYVDGVITYLQNRGRKYVQTVLERLGAYQPMISEVLRKEGLPQDLIYLAAGESAFNPFALSRAGAKGIWQFMPGTGDLYGLKRDRWVDEREDPVRCTQAAARHLKDLYHTFGDWYLAMAAYDWNPAGVQRAIEKTGYADFWTLRKLHALPKETENYVPIFLATALIAKDPKSYGFDVTPNPPLAADQVVVSVPTDLRLVAELIDRPVAELVRLNPSLQRWTTPTNNSAFVLNLPPGTKQSYEQGIVSIPPDRRIWWRAHKVEEGETLSTIAKRFGISLTALAQANQIERDAPLLQGVRLVLPLAPGGEGSLARVRERGPRRAYRYRVRRGDTLELIADRFEVTPYQIRRWNHLRTGRLVSGKTLIVYVPAPASRSARHHRALGHRRSTRRTVAKKNSFAATAFHPTKGARSSPTAVSAGFPAAR